MTDSSQTMVNKYAYTPYGQIVNEVQTIPQPFKFVGQYGVMTETNGFYYMRARYYDPTVGRFISEDPSGFDGWDVNLYAYVGGNPVLRIDPQGLKWSFGSSVGLLIADYGWDSSDPSQASLSAVLGQLGGAGWHATWTSDKQQIALPGEAVAEPVIWNVGLGKYLGVSVADDLSSFSINVGLGIGLPVSAGLPLEGDFSVGPALYNYSNRAKNPKP
jgi:RHS repeat-associated protein